ncbi:hypothetical protein [Planctomyces sp. SH-PL14]|uniref:hypothetical protein n=1 Tax=Planctomyces sp. SH-PL14 TaxID=1632864 RepID=UPI00078B3B31|nr:hypothetical protein [Planctomyces sp. SH-PL14]AMV16967.1 hypothetical protein VT03_03695 [Planctomyces sp. SH-PL14]
MAIQRITILEEEWRLLVDLIAGFNLAHYHPVKFDLALAGLLRSGLVEEVPQGTRVSRLGYQVRKAAPLYALGEPRIWYGVEEPDVP